MSDRTKTIRNLLVARSIWTVACVAGCLCLTRLTFAVEQVDLPAPAEPPVTAADREHWAFRPLLRPELPVVKDVNWCRTHVDRFILARIEAAGLVPTPEADRRTLIRRVTFDLTGLPPTPA